MHLKLTNGTPAKYSLGQLRRDNPNTSFPKLIPDELLASYGVYPYTRSDQQTLDALTQTKVEGDFVETSGAWVLPMVAENKPQADAEKAVRSQRDGLLKHSDWVAIKAVETGVAASAGWSDYRQDLRDVTSQDGFPYSVVWPTKP
jgi:hypothetical protein